ncbi:MAG: hypothetical protein J0L92_07435 [Deltaproteobacteria bacterium]|nr:hypothetical protein [Deltaproteobacteria bacterium]
MRTLVLVPCLFVVVSGAIGCGATRSPDPAPSTAETREATGCEVHPDCASCLEDTAAACNWTGGRCHHTCLMDVSCFGPGNEHAPTCPETQPEESTSF